MNARMLPDHPGTSALAVVAALAIGLGTLTLTVGFASWIAALVATATAAIGWWALVSEP
jgi:hypothetical protein